VRNIIADTTQRCRRCRLPSRWCICAAQESIRTALAVDVVMHHREYYRPSSTGHLVTRIMADARLHLWRRERRLSADEVRRSGREMWILHPTGEEAPAVVEASSIQVVLLDGSWSETSAMAQEIAGWGRRVRLPIVGASRFWLRAQQDNGRFSTAEALLALFEGLELADAQAALRRQLELHVYANLRARGRKDAAAQFLRDSPIQTAFPELLAQLQVRRANLSAFQASDGG